MTFLGFSHNFMKIYSLFTKMEAFQKWLFGIIVVLLYCYFIGALMIPLPAGEEFPVCWQIFVVSIQLLSFVLSVLYFIFTVAPPLVAELSL